MTRRVTEVIESDRMMYNVHVRSISKVKRASIALTHAARQLRKQGRLTRELLGKEDDNNAWDQFIETCVEPRPHGRCV